MDPRGPANRLIRWSGGVGPLFAAAVLGAVLAIQILAMMRASSSTYDEPAVLASGASYVRTGRIQLETTNYPPLMKYLVGLSLEGAGAQFLCRPGFVEQDRFYACGFEYLYRNSVSPEKILFWGRLPSLLMALALGALIWIWSVRWYGPAGGLFALAMFVFEPNLLAHGGLATMDMGLTAFFFAAFFFLSLFVETGRRRPLILAGAAVGAALATKAPGVLALGAFPACLWWGPSPRPRDPRRLVGAVLLSAGVAALVVVAVYQVRFLPRFFELLKFGVGMGFQKGWRNYLHGQILETGYRYFYPLAFFLKTPLAFGLAAVLSFCRRDRRLVFVVAPVLLYVVVFSLSSKQNGLRYVLPIFPFLCLAMGGVPALFGRWKTPAALLLVGGLAIESVGVAPHYLAYFSPLVGGARNGHLWLVDCNLDWGQDFPAIRALWEREGKPELLLATAGLADRDHYFGPHQDVTSDDNTPPWLYYRHVNSTAPTKEWLVVAASKLHGWGVDGDPFAWLRNRKPFAQPGYSSFVFDVTRDPESQFKLGLWYLRRALQAPALRQFRRAGDLDPANPLPLLAEGEALTLAGDAPAARRVYRRALALSGDRPDAAAVLRRRLVDLRAPLD